MKEIAVWTNIVCLIIAVAVSIGSAADNNFYVCSLSSAVITWIVINLYGLFDN